MIQKSEVVNKIVVELLFVNMNMNNLNSPLSDPMTFDNFTLDHFLVFTSGESHTFNPQLHGLNQSIFTIEADNTTYNVNLRLAIPIATLTGSYNLNITQYLIGGPLNNFQGEGIYNHTFYNVEMSMQFTVSETVDGKRAIVSDVHSQLSFQNCVLWAENFKENGNLWSNTEWMAYSAKFKVDYETLIEEVDVLLSQAISSYFGTVWGLFRYGKDAALDWLT
ncbi:hypothetical protein Fcan01_06393 [Folsomia candida]|uniref:Uncharacterized protein n=1 Tax=Folsomia candida TaxID=158441 RepID=A0A226EIA0_FOLCA|nr:hypothetical protein Fcan01_06393 [Folsomia candida]